MRRGARRWGTKENKCRPPSPPGECFHCFNKILRRSFDQTPLKTFGLVPRPIFETNEKAVHSRLIGCQKAIRCHQLLENLIVSRELDPRRSQAEPRNPKVKKFLDWLACESSRYGYNQLEGSFATMIHRFADRLLAR